MHDMMKWKFIMLVVRFQDTIESLNSPAQCLYDWLSVVSQLREQALSIRKVRPDLFDRSVNNIAIEEDEEEEETNSMLSFDLLASEENNMEYADKDYFKEDNILERADDAHYIEDNTIERVHSKEDMDGIESTPILTLKFGENEQC